MYSQTLPQLSEAIQGVAEKADLSVVQILTRGFGTSSEETRTALVQNRPGRGSGVLVSRDGYVVTNAHVIGAARRVEVLAPRKQRSGQVTGKVFQAEVLGLDRETDLAVLKIDWKDAPFLEFGDSDLVRQGQLVLALGSPFGLGNSVSMGVVSSPAREVRPDDPAMFIQTDASINPGNSGGPLVDANGKLVGINTFIFSGSGGSDGVGFAVPSNIVRGVYDQIRAHGRVKRGQIGIIPQTITPVLAGALGLDRASGVILGDVASKSAAEAAGLQTGDIVLSINGKAVETARELGVEIYKHAGDTITLEIVRDRKPLTVGVAVLERPKDPDRLLSLLSSGPINLVSKLRILALDLDERVIPLLQQPRRLSGAVVAGPVSESPDQYEALHAGDVIYSVNGAAVNGLESLKKLVSGLQHGERAALHIERQGQLQYVVVEVE